MTKKFATTDKRKAYEEKFDAQMKEWKSHIALLKARAAKAETKSEYYKTIEALPHKHDEAIEKLHKLKPPVMRQRMSIRGLKK